MYHGVYDDAHTWYPIQGKGPGFGTALSLERELSGGFPIEAVSKPRFGEQPLTPGENCMSRNRVPYKKRLFQNFSFWESSLGFRNEQFSPKACSETNRVLAQAQSS
jgi:hypothetical protein